MSYALRLGAKQNPTQIHGPGTNDTPGNISVRFGRRGTALTRHMGSERPPSSIPTAWYHSWHVIWIRVPARTKSCPPHETRHKSDRETRHKAENEGGV
eukprot:987531-Rhodomonas_salina.2